jgi:hypothetical protein
MYRKMKSDAELYSTDLWKVSWADIERKDQKVKVVIATVIMLNVLG